MVLGSMTSQRKTTVGSLKNGSINAESVSGIKIMSESLMPFQPAMLDPSNILPSSNASSSIVRAGTDTCCSLPLVSVNRKSTYFTPLSLIILITSLADIDPPYIYANAWRRIYYKYARKHGLLGQNPCHVVSS